MDDPLEVIQICLILKISWSNKILNSKMHAIFAYFDHSSFTRSCRNAVKVRHGYYNVIDCW